MKVIFLLLLFITVSSNCLFAQTKEEIIASLKDTLAEIFVEQKQYGIIREGKVIDLTDETYSDQYDGNLTFDRSLRGMYIHGTSVLKYIISYDYKMDDFGSEGKDMRVYYYDSKIPFLIEFTIFSDYKWASKGEEHKIFYYENNPISYTLTTYDVEGSWDDEVDEQKIKDTQIVVEKDAREIPDSVKTLIEENMKLINKYFFK